MKGHSGSVFKAFIFNPLVWIGWVLTWFTMHYEGRYHAFEVFYNIETYRNLMIGTTIYVMLFCKKYREGRNGIDYKETFMTILETMYTILLVWGVSLMLIVNYQLGGEQYSLELAKRYRESGFGGDEQRWPVENVERTIGEVTSYAKEMGLEYGDKIKVTPNGDGTFTVEVLD